MRAQETRALELVAAALSEEYGVRIVSSGFRVHTTRDANNMPVISIPAIPLLDENYRLLIRGYVDHAVGHLRFGEDGHLAEAILAEAGIAGAVQAIVSIYEDARIDRLMGECFFGCGRNLRKLAIYLYENPALPDVSILLERLADGRMAGREMPWHIWQAAVQYVLYFVRSRGLPQLLPAFEAWQDALAALAPGLGEQLRPILEKLAVEDATCESNLGLARETVLAIRDWLTARWQDFSEPWHEESMAELPWLLRNGGQERENADMGKLAAFRLNELINEIVDDSLAKAELSWHRRGSDIWQSRLLPLAQEERQEALQAAAKMSAQIQALLQSHVLNREGPFRQGKLHTRNLHKLFIGRDDLFRRQNERREINTEIVCCIDMSGSMRFDDKAAMASRSLYAVAESIAHIQGLRMHIVGFFDNNLVEMHSSPGPLDDRMKIVPDGGTLCGAALRGAARLFSNDRKMRRMVIMITDGDANDPDYFTEAIGDLGRDGVEILGVGIHDDHITKYLPAAQCCVINDLGELSGSILSMLQKRIGSRG